MSALAAGTGASGCEVEAGAEAELGLDWVCEWATPAKNSARSESRSPHGKREMLTLFPAADKVPLRGLSPWHGSGSGKECLRPSLPGTRQTPIPQLGQKTGTCLRSVKTNPKAAMNSYNFSESNIKRADRPPRKRGFPHPLQRLQILISGRRNNPRGRRAHSVPLVPLRLFYKPTR